ncbi:MAG: TolC family protein [Candidatus Omnitrophica bacterium]|nr:TolC family protein [Candidatus Omnitrophota bacterium]
MFDVVPNHLKRVVVGVMLVPCAWVPLWAADSPTTSLPALLQEALRNNPAITEARTRWQAAQARVPLSKGLPPPRVGVMLEEIPRGTFQVNQATIIYQLIQSLPFPGKRSLRHDMALKEAQVEAMRYQQSAWDVLSDLKAAYYDLFLLDQDQRIQGEQLRWLRQAVASAQARYATGSATHAELLRAQAEALEASNRVTTLEHQRRMTEAHLNHLLNRPTHHAIGSPEPIEPAPVDFSPEELVLIASESQPELLAFKFTAERAGTAVRLAKRELWPDLETMVALRDPAMGPIGPWDLSLALVLPFWFWTKQHYGVRGALFDHASAEAAYQAMRNEIARRIHEHWHGMAAAYTTAVRYRDGLLPLSRQAVVESLAAYQGGRGTFAEALDALRALADQQRGYAEQLTQVEQHTALLEQAVGRPLRAIHTIETMQDGGRAS